MHKIIRFLLINICALYFVCVPAYANNTDISDDYPFNIETTTNVITFEFQIGAAGTFYIDWGDGTAVETIVNDTPSTTYNKEEYDITVGIHVSHTYNVARAYTIKFGGQATAYSVYDGKNEPVPAISFVNSPYVKNLYGSLGAVFPTLGDTDGLQPRFVDTFYGNKNLSTIPSTLFNGVYGNISWQFRSTLERCTKLAQIPDGLFDNVTGAAPQMFRSTFYYDTGLKDIPTGLFKNVSGTAEEMFMYTFYGCSALSDWMPAGLFPDNIDNTTGMFYGTFSSSVSESLCPENMYRQMPLGATWINPVFCAQCPENTISARGSINVKQCFRGCDANQYFDIDALECLDCPDDSTSNGLITDRMMCKCNAGKYMSPTMDACLTCPAPYTNSSAGAVNETQCYLITEPGQYVITPRALPVSCPLGKYCPGGAKIYYSDTRYKPVSWIKSDGVAFIDTGIISRPEYEYTIVTTLNGTAKNESRGLFGARSNTSDAARFVIFTSTIEGHMRYDRYGTNMKLEPVSYDFINDGETHTLTMSASGILYVDNANTVQNMPNFSLGKYNVALFGVNTGGHVEFIDDVNKISSYKVTDSLTGTVIQNLVAMYDTINAEYGMYDTISARFFANAGSGRILGETPDDADTVSGIFSCPDGYVGRPETGAVEISHCQARCVGGSYLPVAKQGCVNVDSQYYSPEHFVNYGNTSPDNIRQQCPVGLTTTGFGTGADEFGDCGKKIHLGTSVLRLRSEKRTSPSLCFGTGPNQTLYADSAPGCRKGHLCITWTDGQNYTIYNPDTDEN